MNLIVSMRQQLKGMEQWYKNALITNIILDYLGLETPNPELNVQTITGLIDSGRVKTYFVGPGDEEYFVDGIKVFTIFKTSTDVLGGSCKRGEVCSLNIWYKFQIDYLEKWKAKPEGDSSGKVVSIRPEIMTLAENLSKGVEE